MLRSALGRRTRYATPRANRRCFHASLPQRTAFEYISSKAYIFHDLFQYTHDYTTLPWVASIPLTVFLLRGIVTLPRIHLAYARRDQAKAAPELALAADIIEKQCQVRRNAGPGIAKNDDWVSKEWELRRREIRKKYPFASPKGVDHSNSDYTRYLAFGIVGINMSTIVGLSAIQPELFYLDLDIPEGSMISISLLFTILAVLNTNYYNGYPRLRDSISKSSKLAQVEESGLDRRLLLGPVVLVGGVLVFCPAPILLAAIGNTTYTLVERKMIQWYIPQPRPEFQTFGRPALQTTKQP